MRKLLLVLAAIVVSMAASPSVAQTWIFVSAAERGLGVGQDFSYIDTENARFGVAMNVTNGEDIMAIVVPALSNVPDLDIAVFRDGRQSMWLVEAGSVINTPTNNGSLSILTFPASDLDTLQNIELRLARPSP